MLCNSHLTYGVVAIEIIANFVFKLIKYHSVVMMKSDELSISIDFLKNNNIIIMGAEPPEGTTSNFINVLHKLPNTEILTQDNKTISPFINEMSMVIISLSFWSK